MFTLQIETIITAVITSGVISALVAPYINWQMEVRKDKRQARKKFINEMRAISCEFSAVDNFSKYQIINTPAFYQFRAYMGKQAILEFRDMLDFTRENEPNEANTKSMKNKMDQLIEQEINRLEKKWKLI